MLWPETLTALCVSGIAAVYTLMPQAWCEQAHTRELGALLVFLALLVYLVLADSKKSPAPTPWRTALGVLCGLALALVCASAPAGYVLAGVLGGALARFGLDWAA